MNHDYSEVPGRQQQEGMAHPAAIYRTVRRAQGSGGSSLQHLRPKPAGWVREGSRRLGCARGVRNASTSGPATESSPPPQAHRFQWAARIGTEFSRHLLGSLHFYDEKVASYWAATDLSTDKVDKELAGKKDAAVATYRDVEERLEHRTQLLMQIDSVKSALGQIAKVHHLDLPEPVAGVPSPATDPATTENLWRPQPPTLVFGSHQAYHSALEELQKEEERWRKVLRRNAERDMPHRRFTHWDKQFDTLVEERLESARQSLEPRLSQAVSNQTTGNFDHELRKLTDRLAVAHAAAIEAAKIDPEMGAATVPLTTDFLDDFVSSAVASTEHVCNTPGRALGQLPRTSDNLIRSLRMWHYTETGKQSIPLDLAILNAYKEAIRGASAEFASEMWKEIDGDATEVQRIEQSQVQALKDERTKKIAMQSKKAVEVGAEHEAAKLFEEIKTLNQRIAAFTANDEKLDVTKQLFDRIVTIRESLWLATIKSKEDEWLQFSTDAGASRAAQSLQKWGDAANSLCQASQFKLQQQGLEALVAHRDWSEAAMKRTSWRGFLFSGLGFVGTFTSVIVGIVFARLRTQKVMNHTTQEADRIVSATSNGLDDTSNEQLQTAEGAVIDAVPEAPSTAAVEPRADAEEVTLVDPEVLSKCGSTPKETAKNLSDVFGPAAYKELVQLTEDGGNWLQNAAQQHREVLALSTFVAIVAGTIGAAVTQALVR